MQKKLFKDEIAFALEMMSQGYQQKYIAQALSVTRGSLREAIKKAMHHGAKEKPFKQTTAKRIKHTNRRAAAILAAGSSRQNMSGKDKKRASRNAG